MEQQFLTRNVSAMLRLDFSSNTNYQFLSSYVLDFNLIIHSVLHSLLLNVRVSSKTYVPVKV
jgi:hypothetical protein